MIKPLCILYNYIWCSKISVRTKLTVITCENGWSMFYSYNKKHYSLQHDMYYKLVAHDENPEYITSSTQTTLSLSHWAAADCPSPIRTAIPAESGWMSIYPADDYPQLLLSSKEKKTVTVDADANIRRYTTFRVYIACGRRPTGQEKSIWSGRAS